MKNLLLVSLWLFLIYSCHNQKTLNNKKVENVKLVMIELNTDVNHEFGLPVKSEYFSKLFFYLADGKSAKKEFGSQSIFIRMIKDSLFFEYRELESRKSIIGKYLVPNYREIEYKKINDLGSNFASEITPLYVYVPVRNGVWVYSEGQKKNEVIYDIRINEEKSDAPSQE